MCTKNLVHQHVDGDKEMKLNEGKKRESWFYEQ